MWFNIDPDEHQRSPYDLTGDQIDLLVKDVDKEMQRLADEDATITTRRLVEMVLELLEEWHG